MTKKRIYILDKKDDFIEKDKKEELTGELFDINSRKGLINIPLSQLVVNPNQPRKTFHENTISELAESIKEHGVLNPIIVRPSGEIYEIIAGERRFKAAGQAGLKEIPAIIKKASDEDSWIISLIENIQREDLNDIDRASALRELKKSLNLSWIELGKRIGLSKRRVLELVSLLDLPDEIKEDIRQKKLTGKHGRALRLLLGQAEVLRNCYNFIKEKNLTSNESLELIEAVKGAPERTIEESYNELKNLKSKKTKTKKEDIETAILESKRLIKTLGKNKLIETNSENIESLKENLKELQKIIENLLKSV